MDYMKNFDEAEKFDNLKTKAVKHILYMKRTEQDIRKKFRNEDQELLEKVIKYLKEQNYINDYEYIEKAFNEYMKLKNMSIKEFTYKLGIKGIEKNLIDEYVYNNKERLLDYEIQSAKNILIKQLVNKEKQEIYDTLLRKGYMVETINIIKAEDSN